jgi:hypothetical protein
MVTRRWEEGVPGFEVLEAGEADGAVPLSSFFFQEQFVTVQSAPLGRQLHHLQERINTHFIK